MVVNYQRLREQVEQQFKCVHERATLRVKVARNGARHYRVQCARCGETRPASVAERASCPNPEVVDEELQHVWWERKNKAYKRLYEQESEAKRRAWFDQYAEFLKSPEWERCRSLALDRDQFVCQAHLPGCTRRATEVHHITYDHWWNPPLWELQSVCQSCHEQITEMDRAKK